MSSNSFLKILSSQRGAGKTAGLLRMENVWQAMSTVGPLTAAERRFIENQLFIQAERFANERDAIESQTFLPVIYQHEGAIERPSEKPRDWSRWYWRTIAKIESKVLARRKGTVRSGSRNGSQTCCTHTMAIYESDLTARWLVGLLPSFDRLARAVRSQVDCIGSRWESPGKRRDFKNLTFDYCAA